MKGTVGFLFFMLFLAAFALVSLQSGQQVAPVGAAAGNPLTRNDWKAVRLFGMSVPGDAGISVSFLADGRLVGSAGCNRYSGRYEPGDGGLRIESMRATRRSCDDAVMTLEESLFDVFRDVRRTSFADGDLRLLDGEGDWLATFRAADAPAGGLSEGS